jgi:DNA recombination protein Rad52
MMPFTNEQVAALSAKLNGTHVKSRSQAGRQLSYIEGWHAIAEANRIFGFHAWDRTLSALKELGAPREVDGKWRVAWMATVRITVVTDNGMPVVRDGTGYGSGIDKDLGQAHESAIKEAETDAMKRALMTFGNPFGLALYDKTQEDVEREPPKAAPKPTPAPPPQASAPPDWWGRDNLEIPVARGDYGAWSERIKKAIDAAPDLPKINKLMSDNGAHLVAFERDEKAGAAFIKDRAAKRRAVFAQGEVRDA